MWTSWHSGCVGWLWGHSSAFAATRDAGHGSFQRFVGYYLVRKSPCFRKKTQRKTEWKEGEDSPRRVLLAGWFEEGGRIGTLWLLELSGHGVPVSDICWHWGSPVFARWLSFMLFSLSSFSQCCLGNLWEGKWEWIKELEAAGMAEAQLALPWGVALTAKLWIIKPPTLSCYWMKYFSLWWKRSSGKML